MDAFVGHYPLYSFTTENENGRKVEMGLQCFYYGSSSAAVAVEELQKRGAKRFVFVGRAHPATKMIQEGNLLIPSRAIRDEGSSFHYLEPSKEVFGSLALAKIASKWLDENGINTTVGATWTTDVSVNVALSTKDIKEANCEAVDFETATILAVAEFHDLEVLPLLIVEHLNLTKALRKILQSKKEKQFRKDVLEKSVTLLANDAFWKEKNSIPKEKENARVNLIPKIEELLKEIHHSLDHPGKNLSPTQEVLIHALREKTAIFEKEFKRLRKEKHAFLSNSSGTNLLKDIYKILQKVRNAVEDVLSRTEPKEEELVESKFAVEELDLAIEDILAQLADQPEPLVVEEPAKDIQPTTNLPVVMLVNLPRRFRYKPEYKKYFSGEHEIKKVQLS